MCFESLLSGLEKKNNFDVWIFFRVYRVSKNYSFCYNSTKGILLRFYELWVWKESIQGFPIHGVCQNYENNRRKGCQKLIIFSKDEHFSDKMIKDFEKLIPWFEICPCFKRFRTFSHKIMI